MIASKTVLECFSSSLYRYVHMYFTYPNVDFPKVEHVNGVYAERAQNVTQNEAGGGPQQQDPMQDILGMLCGLVQTFCANQANEPSRTMEETSPLSTRENIHQQVIGEISVDWF